MAQVHAIVAADSRAKGFLRRPVVNDHLYESHYVVCPGGDVHAVGVKLHKLVNTLPTSSLVLIRIACGINEITYKDKHDGGTELALRPHQDVLYHLRQLKASIKLSHPRVHVAFATIPPINFTIAQQYYLKRGWLRNPKYTNDTLSKFQSELSSILANVNRELCRENISPQYIPGWGSSSGSQSFWHQEVEKVAHRKRSGKLVKVKRIPLCALPDGVHAEDSIVNGWFSRTHQNFKKDLIKIKSGSVHL